MGFGSEQRKAEIIDGLATQMQSRLRGDEAELARRFVRAYYRDVSAEDLAERDPLDLYGAALAQLRSAEVRQPGELKLRVYNPRLEQHGWQSTHTVVEIVNDDMPFLVDSVGVALSRLGLSVHLVIHPVLEVRRDAAGRLEDVANTDPAVEGPRESFMLFEIDRQSRPQVLAQIEADLRRVLGDVRNAVQDWRAMRERIGAALAELGAALEGRGTLLATIPAIDPFPGRPGTHEYIGPMPASRLPAVEGALPEVFASLRMDHPHTEAALQALRGCGRRVWAYVPDSTPAWCARISTPDLLVSPQPFDLPTALGACRAVVTYGGHSLVLAALLAGRPLLLLPGSGEQQLTAMKVTELGAGLAAGRDERPARVATALKRILEEAAFTEAARRIEADQPPDVGSRALARAVAACEAAVMPSAVPLKVVR